MARSTNKSASSVRSEFSSASSSSLKGGKIRSVDDLVGLLGKKLTNEEKENIKEYLSKFGFDNPADIYSQKSKATSDMLNEEKTLLYARSIKNEESLNKSGEDLSREELRKFYEDFPKPKGKDSYASILLRKLDKEEESEKAIAKLKADAIDKLKAESKAIREKHEKIFGVTYGNDIDDMKRQIKEYRKNKLPKEIEKVQDNPEKLNSILPKNIQSVNWGKQTVSGFSEFEDYGADKPKVKELKSWVDSAERSKEVEVRNSDTKEYPIKGKNASWVVKEKTIYATEKWMPDPKTWVLKDVKELYYKDKKGEKFVNSTEDYYSEGG